MMEIPRTIRITGHQPPMKPQKLKYMMPKLSRRKRTPKRRRIIPQKIE